MSRVGPGTPPRAHRPSPTGTGTGEEELAFSFPANDGARVEEFIGKLQQNTRLRHLALHHALPAGLAGDTLIYAVACHASIERLTMVGAGAVDLRRLAALLPTVQMGALSSVSLAGVEPVSGSAANAIVALIAAGVLETLALQFDFDDAQARLMLHAGQRHQLTTVDIRAPPSWTPERTAELARIIKTEEDAFRAGLQQVHGFAPPGPGRRHRMSAAEAACVRLMEDARAFCVQWESSFGPSARFDGLALLPHELSERAAAFASGAESLRQGLKTLHDVPVALRQDWGKVFRRCSEVRRQAVRIRLREDAFKLASFDLHLQQMS